MNFQENIEAKAREAVLGNKNIIILLTFQEIVEVKAREAVLGNEKKNNSAESERLRRLDQFKKLKTRL